MKIKDISKSTVFSAAGLALVIIMVFQYFSYNWFVSKITQIEEKDSYNSYDSQMKTLLADGENLLLSLLDSLAYDKRIRIALKKQNHDFIMREFDTQFNEIKTKHLITHWYFYNDQKKVLARLHNANKFGEISKRKGLALGYQNSSSQIQLDFGDSNILTLRAIKPVYEGTQLIGAIEMGMDLANLFSQRYVSKLPHHFSYVLLSKISTTDPAKWENYSDIPSTDELKLLLSESKAEPDELRGLFQNFKSITHQSGIPSSYGKLYYQPYNVTYNSENQEIVGKLIMIYPIKSVFPAIRNTALAISILSSLIFTVLIISFVWLFNANREVLQYTFAQSKMSTLGEMAAGVAHEINNPLAIISGKSQQIARLLHQKDPNLEQVFANLSIIDRTVSRIAKVIKGLKHFSRNSENDPFEYLPANLILNESLELCLERIKAHQIELRLQEVSTESFECRPVQIAQVLLNLIGNAIDAVESLPTKWIEIEFKKEAQLMVFSITDSGHGIPQKMRDKIMEPFYSTKEIGKGTGLGLSISKGIIESHKGVFSYDSSSENTRFIFKIPITQSDHQTTLQKLSA